MSVLDNKLAIELTASERSASRVSQVVSTMAYQLISQWNQGWDALWLSEDPDAVLAEIGTDAEEIFALNDDIIDYFTITLAGRKQDELDAILAKVAAKPATTTAADGSVTID
jgi:hypothetical protein